MFIITAREEYTNEEVVIEFRKNSYGIHAKAYDPTYFIGSLFNSREAALIALGFAHDVKNARDFKIEEFHGSLVGVAFEEAETQAVEYFENLAK